MRREEEPVLLTPLPPHKTYLSSESILVIQALFLDVSHIVSTAAHCPLLDSALKWLKLGNKLSFKSCSVIVVKPNNG